MFSAKNISLPGAEGLPIGLDVFHDGGKRPKPVFIYAHGFSGFKDWGNFDLMAGPICAAGFVLVKFNFSHNGTSAESPESFVNLEAFGNNNYSKQLFDLKAVVDWVADPNNLYAPYIDPAALFLIGHSMGGGISILYAAADSRIKKLVTWAAISECKTPWGVWSQERLDKWKRTGVEYYPNSRTGQQMPLHYQLYEDYVHNEERLNIQKAIARLQIPILICHGTEDTSVNFTSALQLQVSQPAASLFTLPTDHVFGRMHPWPETFLPEDMERVLNETLAFLKN